MDQQHDQVAQDLRRKQSHSQIEKRRRQKISLQISTLSTMIPNLPIHAEKLDVLKATTVYIQKLQDCLKKYEDDPRVRQYLPVKKSTIDLLLPNYVPFSTIKTFEGYSFKPTSPPPQKNPKMDIRFLIN